MERTSGLLLYDFWMMLLKIFNYIIDIEYTNTITTGSIATYNILILYL